MVCQKKDQVVNDPLPSQCEVNFEKLVRISGN